MLYDCGDFPTVLDKALTSADWDGFAARRRQPARGKLRGRGIGQLPRGHRARRQRNGRHPLRGRRHRDDDHRHTRLRPGPATPFAQVLVDELGIPFDKISLLQGDSDQLLAGGGTGGSSRRCERRAILEASRHGDRGGKKIAAHVLEAAVATSSSRARPLQHRRHRPRHRHPGTGGAARRRQAAGRRAAARSMRPRRSKASPRLSQRLPRRRGRDRPGDRRDRSGQLQHGQRLRRADQSDAGGGPGAWRHRAGYRPGADWNGGLRRGRPAATGTYMDYALPRATEVPGFRFDQPSGAGARPIRSAPKAAARPAVPARCRR